MMTLNSESLNELIDCNDEATTIRTINKTEMTGVFMF